MNKLRSGMTYVRLLFYMLSRRQFACLLGVLPFFTSDRLFLERVYRAFLGREIDQQGLAYYMAYLREGHCRLSVLFHLFTSDEFHDNYIKASTPQLELANIKRLRPQNYRSEINILTQERVSVFVSEQTDDFDWLEAMILEHNYYEKDGVWGVVINLDKRVMAEIMAHFAPERALEIGCANGAVMQCLYALGISCEGIEISQLALQRAFPQIKSNIHQGDLLRLDLTGSYDFIFGLDVFEHLNPNKLDDYISRIYSLLRDGGYVFCNIPAFGSDPLFGCVFPLYVADWARSAQEGRKFSVLEVDAEGYPIHGHLIWADSAWWVRQFERYGFQRELEIEQALHTKYDIYMDKVSPARKAYYVFSKNAMESRRQAIMARIAKKSSYIDGI